jgi:hypothetical protein
MVGLGESLAWGGLDAITVDVSADILSLTSMVTNDVTLKEHNLLISILVSDVQDGLRHKRRVSTQI